MDIARTWYATLYLRIRYAWSRFFHGEWSAQGFEEYLTHDTLNYTNLCQFVRTLFVWGPLYLLIMSVPLTMFLVVLIYYPATYFGVDTVAKWMFLVGIGTLTILSGILALIWIVVRIANSKIVTGFIDGVRVKFSERRRRKIERYEQDYDSDDERPEKRPGFFELLWKWLQDKHENFCTSIKLG